MLWLYRGRFSSKATRSFLTAVLFLDHVTEVGPCWTGTLQDESVIVGRFETLIHVQQEHL